MALNSSKCNLLMPLHFKGLNILYVFVILLPCAGSGAVRGCKRWREVVKAYQTNHSVVCFVSKGRIFSQSFVFRV